VPVSSGSSKYESIRPVVGFLEYLGFLCDDILDSGCPPLDPRASPRARDDEVDRVLPRLCGALGRPDEVGLITSRALEDLRLSLLLFSLDFGIS